MTAKRLSEATSPGSEPPTKTAKIPSATLPSTTPPERVTRSKCRATGIEPIQTVSRRGPVKKGTEIGGQEPKEDDSTTEEDRPNIDLPAPQSDDDDFRVLSADDGDAISGENGTSKSKQQVPVRKGSASASNTSDSEDSLMADILQFGEDQTTDDGDLPVPNPVPHDSENIGRKYEHRSRDPGSPGGSLSDEDETRTPISGSQVGQDGTRNFRRGSRGGDIEDYTMSELRLQLNDVKGQLSRANRENGSLNFAFERLKKSEAAATGKVEKLESDMAVLRAASTDAVASGCGSRITPTKRYGKDIGNGVESVMKLKASLEAEGMDRAFVHTAVVLHRHMYRVAKCHATETVQGTRRTVAFQAPWGPNNSDDGNMIVRDWRFRTVPIPIASGYGSFSEIPDHSPSGALLVKYDSDAGGRHRVSHQSVPLCPMELSRASQFFSSTDKAMKIAIGESAAQSHVPTDTTEDVIDLERLSKQAGDSAVLIEKLKESCTENVGARKKALKHAFYFILATLTSQPRCERKRGRRT